MLRQALKGFAAGLNVEAGALLAAAGIEPTRRAEEIDVAGFVALARAAARFTKSVNATASRAP
jgi:16S rRNA (adenine1518-N6/adenine1519-N6)-dimethyltransferase